jgi:ribosome maturation factor RimP
LSNVESIQALIEPSVEALGFELWGLELVAQGRFSTLRIYIESAKGITVDDCAEVSHQVSGIMDVEDPITNQYTLEVSSPGVDRPLFKQAHYEQYIGQFMRVRLHSPFDGRRKFAGVLMGLEADEIVLLVDQEEYLLPIDAIDKAALDTTMVVKPSK